MLECQREWTSRTLNYVTAIITKHDIWIIIYHAFFHSALVFVWLSGKRMIISLLNINWRTQQFGRIVLCSVVRYQPNLKYHLEKMIGFKTLSFWVTTFQDCLKPSQLCPVNLSACRTENQQVDLLRLTTVQIRIPHRLCSASTSQRAARQRTVKIRNKRKERSLIAF